jgi:hypothetical protein
MSCVFNNQAVKPIWGRTKETDEYMGWVFPESNTEVLGAEPDRLNGAKSVRELYEIASTNYSGKFTVPVGFRFYNGLVSFLAFLIFVTHQMLIVG